MLVYRFSKLEFLNDLSGYGAKIFGGRWNSKGHPVLYTSGSASLAMLEFVCNTNNKITFNKTGIITLDIPSPVKVFEMTAKDLPHGWKEYPAPDILQDLGDQWLKLNKYPVLKVPSAVVPIEFNYLINPLHKDFSLIRAVIKHPMEIDKRIRH